MNVSLDPGTSLFQKEGTFPEHIKASQTPSPHRGPDGFHQLEGSDLGIGKCGWQVVKDVQRNP